MKYLDLLKAKNGEKPPPYPVPKVPKAPFVTFGTGPGDHVSRKKEADPLLVEVWTPAGTRMTVLADSPDHAEQIRRWNPRPQTGANPC